MHPAHITFLERISQANLDQLFKILDGLDSDIRDNIFGFTYERIINPTYIRVNSSLKHTDQVNYKVFKEKCYRLAQWVHHHFLAYCIVADALQWVFPSANIACVDEELKYSEKTIELARKLILYKKDQMPFDEEDKELREAIADELKNMSAEELEGYIQFMQERVKGLPTRTYQEYQLYQTFCENVIAPLNEIIITLR